MMLVNQANGARSRRPGYPPGEEVGKVEDLFQQKSALPSGL